MLQDLARAGQLSLFGAPLRRWAGSVVLAIAVGIAYFLASRLSLLLLTKPDDVAVFWPAAGVAAGVLVAWAQHKIAGGGRHDSREHPGQSFGRLEPPDFHPLCRM
jgi:hypothetical protein